MTFGQIFVTVLLGGICFWAMIELQQSESDRKRVVSFLMFIPTTMICFLIIAISFEANKKKVVPEIKKESYELVTDSLYRKHN